MPCGWAGVTMQTPSSSGDDPGGGGRGSVEAIAEAWTPWSPRLTVDDHELRSQLHRNTVTMLIGERRKFAEKMVAWMTARRSKRQCAAALRTWRQHLAAAKRARRCARIVTRAVRRHHRDVLMRVVRAWQLMATRVKSELRRTLLFRTEQRMQKFVQSTLAEYDYVRQRYHAVVFSYRHQHELASTDSCICACAGGRFTCTVVHR